MDLQSRVDALNVNPEGMGFGVSSQESNHAIPGLCFERQISRKGEASLNSIKSPTGRARRWSILLNQVVSISQLNSSTSKA